MAKKMNASMNVFGGMSIKPTKTNSPLITAQKLETMKPKRTPKPVAPTRTSKTTTAIQSERKAPKALPYKPMTKSKPKMF